jgi:hypothetical protein
MGMIRNKHPCIAGSFGFRQERRKALQRVFPVFSAHEDIPTLYTPNHDVV